MTKKVVPLGHFVVASFFFNCSITQTGLLKLAYVYKYSDAHYFGFLDMGEYKVPIIFPD
jgi:hypothetical protein